MRLHTTPRSLGEPPIGAFAMVPLFGLPLGAWLVETQTLTLATCGFKQLLDLPCLSCGSTRATVHLFRGDLLTAISFQPMTMLIYLLLAVWGGLSLWAYVTRRSLHLDLSKRQDFALKASLVAIPIMNWAYLVTMGI